jgi:hypothetical protein
LLCIRVRPSFIRGSALASLILLGLGPSDPLARYTVTGKSLSRASRSRKARSRLKTPPLAGEFSPPVSAAAIHELPAGDFRVSVSPPLVETKAGPDSPGDMVPKKVANIPKNIGCRRPRALAKVERDKRSSILS